MLPAESACVKGLTVSHTVWHEIPSSASRGSPGLQDGSGVGLSEGPCTAWESSRSADCGAGSPRLRRSCSETRAGVLGGSLGAKLAAAATLPGCGQRPEKGCAGAQGSGSQGLYGEGGFWTKNRLFFLHLKKGFHLFFKLLLNCLGVAFKIRICWKRLWAVHLFSVFLGGRTIKC